jgi:hypothetical protein
MSLSWSGMSKDRCLSRASEVNQGSGNCGHVSYSASSEPQSQTNFCRCYSSCPTALEQPTGEVWETYVVGSGSGGSDGSDGQGFDGQGSNSSASSTNTSSVNTSSVNESSVTESSVTSDSDGGQDSDGSDDQVQFAGRCPGFGYISLSFSGMSKQACLQHAYNMDQENDAWPSGQCSHVSYSASLGPQLSGNFCRCFFSCPTEMVHQPAGEDWETYVIHSNDGTVPRGASPSNSKALALRVVACLGVVLGLAVIFWSFCCCCGAKKGSHQAEPSQDCGAGADGAEGCATGGGGNPMGVSVETTTWGCSDIFCERGDNPMGCPWPSLVPAIGHVTVYLHQYIAVVSAVNSP